MLVLTAIKSRQQSHARRTVMQESQEKKIELLRIVPGGLKVLLSLKLC